MSAYFKGPACWFLSEPDKAAHNYLLVGVACELFQPETVTAAYGRILRYLPGLKLQGSDLPRPVFMCLLAQAFAEDGVYPRMLKADGNPVVLCWYRIKDIPNACAAMSEAHLATAQASLARWSGRR